MHHFHIFATLYKYLALYVESQFLGLASISWKNLQQHSKIIEQWKPHFYHHVMINIKIIEITQELKRALSITQLNYRGWVDCSLSIFFCHPHHCIACTKNAILMDDEKKYVNFLRISFKLKIRRSWIHIQNYGKFGCDVDKRKWFAAPILINIGE